MIDITVNFILILINTVLMIVFINKDYKLNWKSKKVFTYSRYSKIASIFGFANIGVTTGFLDTIFEKYFDSFFNPTFNIIISWVIIPAICIFIFFSIFYATYSQFIFKQKHGIKEK